MPYDWKTELPGIIARHANSCPIRDGGKCTCGPLGYLASVRDRESNRRRVSPMYDTTDEALVWQVGPARARRGVPATLRLVVQISPP